MPNSLRVEHQRNVIGASVIIEFDEGTPEELEISDPKGANWTRDLTYHSHGVSIEHTLTWTEYLENT